MSPERFEAWVQATLPGDRAIALDRDSRIELKRAIDGFDLVSVRAAVILARTLDPRCYELLLLHLEKRLLGPDRPDDAAGVVAAAALGQARLVREQGKRLEELVVGSEPHPDLEVRVECAASLLGYGRTRVAGFLLKVLRDQTPAADDSKRNWTPTPHMAWAKSRAAAALSKYAGVSNEFRPDASVQAQAEEAARLERLYREKKQQLERGS